MSLSKVWEIVEDREALPEVTTENAEIQRIIRDYYEQPYDNKMDNLEEMDRFLEKFSLSVMSNSLRPHGLQHTRLPCPSPTPGAYSNSCPSSW